MAGDTKAFTIPAGGTYPINGNGETYIFCQFADRPIRVKIAGKTVTMRAGGYQEFEPLSGPNARVEFENTDSDNPAAVIFILGTGTYDEKIVRGEISIEPILRNADGTTKPDTRHTVDIDLLPVAANIQTLAVGDLLWQGAVDQSVYTWRSGGGIHRRPDGLIGQNLMENGDYNEAIALFDEKGQLVDMGFIERIVGYERNSLIWTPGTSWTVSKDNAVIGNLNLGSTSGSVTYFTWSKMIESMTVDGDLNIVLIDRDLNVAVVNSTTFEVIKTAVIAGVPKDGSWEQRIAYDAFYDRYYLQPRDADRHYILNADFEVIENRGPFVGDPAINEGRDVYRNQIYTCGDYFSTKIATAKVFEEYQTSPKLEAVRPFCGLNNALLKRTDPIVLTAQLTAREVSAGIQIEGELIKAALEYYYRAQVPDDYLNHIYGFDVSRDQNGGRVKKVISGNRTFAAANIADNFSTLAPSRIKIIIDNELQLGANL
jgi:hypothetical protein